MRHHSANKQTSVRTALDCQIGRGGVLLTDEVLAGRNEIIKHILLVHQPAGIVPFFSVLTAAAQIGLSKHAAVFQPNNAGSAERGSQADTKSSISTQPCWIFSVQFNAFFVHNKHGDLCAILTGIKHLLRFVCAWFEIYFRARVQGGLTRLNLILVNRCGCRKRCEAVINFLLIYPATKSTGRTNSRQLNVTLYIALKINLTILCACIFQVADKHSLVC